VPTCTYLNTDPDSGLTNYVDDQGRVYSDDDTCGGQVLGAIVPGATVAGVSGNGTTSALSGLSGLFSAIGVGVNTGIAVSQPKISAAGISSSGVSPAQLQSLGLNLGATSLLPILLIVLLAVFLFTKKE